jgi:demethylmenaquinone methyltransferase / 2-methoxy-6-polyprenyl-1,4-benzoquinol methylase
VRRWGEQSLSLAAGWRRIRLTMPDAATIQQMFTEVAPGYDRANRALSMGIDVMWRRRTVKTVALQPGERGLDVCSGTGDLCFALQRAGANMLGADFCAPMLSHTHQKQSVGGARVEFLAADAMNLPFGDDTFDFATVAFGIRNVADPVVALREMARVVRPGGRVVVLEFCKPRVPVFAQLYQFYFAKILPTLGKWISGTKNDAYRYLHDSVQAFPERAAFLDLMRQAGLCTPSQRLLTAGIAAIYRGEVPQI